MQIARRWFRLASPLLLTLLLTGAGGGGTALGQDLAALEEVAAETAALRELPPVAALDPVFLTREEAEVAIEALLREEWDEDGIAAAIRSAATLGLVPAEINLLQLNIDLLGESAGGYYDPETGNLVVIQDGSFGALEAYVLSHEVTHVLQAEHLGLDELIDGMDDLTDDEILARVALYEGDASLTSILYVASKPVLALQLGAQLAAGGDLETAVFDTAPPVISLGLVFPYLTGTTFVQSLYEDGGWAAVDAAYASPPTSTEQILHTDKYLAGEEPVDVALPEAAATLGAGWEEIDDNRMGEFQIAVLLADLDPGAGLNDLMGTIELPDAASAAAAGWDGDRYQLWTDGEDAEAFVWASVWESDAEAEEFFLAFRAYEEARHDAGFTSERPDDLTLELDGGVARLALAGDTVSYVRAPTADQANQILDELMSDHLEKAA
ncbi:MAG: hypothetical protein H0V24_09645 [Chloroflexia bacterium]|nr:hypothetical protein [Chloroflexia bacterium]